MKFLCIKDWYLKDKRHIFIKDKEYKKVFNSSQLAITGENETVMYMELKQFNEHFKIM